MRLRALAVLIAIVVGSCAGDVDHRQPAGYLDSTGAFHTPDGTVLFSPGSACAGYDLRRFPITDDPSCSNDAECASWARAHLPVHFPVAVNCSHRCGGWISGGWPKSADPLYCTPGPSGDAYCHAFWKQFLLGAGERAVSCSRKCLVSDADENGIPHGSGCKTYSDWGTCNPNDIACHVTDPKTGEDVCTDGTMLCVERNGKLGCEPPCAPPPNP